jgi:hypothetical protein
VNCNARKTNITIPHNQSAASEIDTSTKDGISMTEESSRTEVRYNKWQLRFIRVA